MVDCGLRHARSPTPKFFGKAAVLCFLCLLTTQRPSVPCAIMLNLISVTPFVIVLLVNSGLAFVRCFPVLGYACPFEIALWPRRERWGGAVLDKTCTRRCNS